MSSELRDAMRAALTIREERGELRRLTPPSDLTSLVDFSSNDYLGIRRSTAVKEHTKKWQRRLGPVALEHGASGSRLLSGNSIVAETLEAKLATFHQAESALLINSGYDANVALIASARIGETGLILYDDAIHASAHDGMRMLRHGSRQAFRHNDVEDLTRSLVEFGGRGTVIVLVEAIYSMEGSAALLQEIAKVCETHKAWFVVDEAHSVGVIGPSGAGLCQQLGLHRHSMLLARLVTFGKALGGHGAAILGNKLLTDYLTNFARPLIYSTALPASTLVGILASYDALPEVEYLRTSLFEKISFFKKVSKSFGLSLASTGEHPIQAVLVPGAKRCVYVANALKRACGLSVFPIRTPTVAPGGEMLRVVLHSWNTREELVSLIENLAKLIKRSGDDERLRGRL